MAYKKFIIILVAAVIVTGLLSYYLSPVKSTKVIVLNEETSSFLKPAEATLDGESFLAAIVKSFQNKRRKVITPTATTSFTDSFEDSLVIEETNSPDISSSARWWLNSGGYFVINGGVGSTVQGELSNTDRWYGLYSKSNPLDTDGGVHPQNIFRLVEKDLWTNFSQEVYFKINKTNLSGSPNRAAHNGILLFNRYQSGDDLYYVGIRADGAVVIKKKYKSVYYTLAYKKILPGTYNRDTNPNLLPVQSWYGIKSEVSNATDGGVFIKIYIDPTRSGAWTFVLEARDVPGVNGDSVISASGFAGIRTDFMDVEFDDYKIRSL